MKCELLPTLVVAVTATFVIGTTVGCSGSKLPTYPVSGQVVFPDGSTLERGGIVRFICNDVTPPVTADGIFGPDGKYQLTTFHEGDGAVAGEHQVIVIATVPDDREPGMSLKEYTKSLHPIDDRFKNPSASGLRFTVSAETSPHEFRIEVTRPKRRR